MWDGALKSLSARGTILQLSIVRGHIHWLESQLHHIHHELPLEEMRMA